MPPPLTQTLGSLLGDDQVVRVEATPTLSRALGGCVPPVAVMPQTALQLATLLKLAAENGLALIPYGTELACGAPPQKADVLLDLRQLEPILEHEPGDLTVRASASTSFALLQDTLARHEQRLPIEAPAAAATLGDLLATRASGPRRLAFGTLRDHVLGLSVATPDGKITRCGGRVVKNVTGYDLMKLHVGALHTLGIVLELNLRLQPRPERELAILAIFDRIAQACAFAHHMRLEPELQPVALDLATSLGSFADIPVKGAAIGVLFEGSEAAVEQQVDRARTFLRDGVEVHLLAGRECEALIERLTEARAIDVSDGPLLVVRCLAPRGQLAAVLEAVQRGPLGHRIPRCVGWAGLGIIDAMVGGDLDRDADLPGEVAGLAQALAHLDGSLALRAAPPFVWATFVRPRSEAVARIERQLRTLVDPGQVLNPGRLSGLP
ncbi:MAG: FAD-binding oxidoreductase [Planctomycetota bacterium]